MDFLFPFLFLIEKYVRPSPGDMKESGVCVCVTECVCVCEWVCVPVSIVFVNCNIVWLRLLFFPCFRLFRLFFFSSFCFYQMQNKSIVSFGMIGCSSFGNCDQKITVMFTWVSPIHLRCVTVRDWFPRLKERVTFDKCIGRLLFQCLSYLSSFTFETEPH